MKQPFVVNQKVRPTQIPALPDSWVANTTSVKILYPQKKIASSYIFIKILRA
jgi:hypothetical protein